MSLHTSVVPFLCAVVLIVTLILSGCTSSTPVEPISPRSHYLTGTMWVLQKALARGQAPGDTADVTWSFPYLTVQFGGDGRYQSSSRTGTWQWTGGESGIVFDRDSAVQTVTTVVDLSPDVLHMTTPAAPGVIGSMDLTFMPALKAPNFREVNFEILWREFNARYSFFDVKGVNWDSLYTVYRPQVTAQTADFQLFPILSSLLDHLKDPHVNLSGSYGSYVYTGWYTDHPANFPGTSTTLRYLSTDLGYVASGYMRFGKIGTDIGYVYVGPQLYGDGVGWTQGIDAIVDALAGTKGIIIDLRGNTGGNDALGSIVAGRFADQQRTYSYIRWRNGPLHGDFTDFQPLTIQPQGPRQYTKPVAVLTNRRCLSSTEGTVLMFRALPHVTIIGDTTGGASGNPITLTLPNGWSYRVPRWIQYTAEKSVFEGRGIAPDIPVWITPADSAAGKDTILEKALQYLQAK